MILPLILNLQQPQSKYRVIRARSKPTATQLGENELRTSKATSKSSVGAMASLTRVETEHEQRAVRTGGIVRGYNITGLEEPLGLCSWVSVATFPIPGGFDRRQTRANVSRTPPRRNIDFPSSPFSLSPLTGDTRRFPLSIPVRAIRWSIRAAATRNEPLPSRGPTSFLSAIIMEAGGDGYCRAPNTRWSTGIARNSTVDWDSSWWSGSSFHGGRWVYWKGESQGVGEGLGNWGEFQEIGESLKRVWGEAEEGLRRDWEGIEKKLRRRCSRERKLPMTWGYGFWKWEFEEIGESLKRVWGEAEERLRKDWEIEVSGRGDLL